MAFPMSLVENTWTWFPLNLGSKFKPLLHAGSPFRICKKDPLILFHPNFITHVDSIFSCSLLLSDCKDLGTENAAGTQGHLKMGGFVESLRTWVQIPILLHALWGELFALAA